MTPAFAQAFFHSAGPKFLAFVAVPAVRALLVGCAAALALAALRVKRPPARLQVWTAVLCAALAMPLLGILLPRTPFAIPARTIESVSREIPLPVWHSILDRRKLAATPAVEAAQMPAPSAPETGKSLLGSHEGGTALFRSGAGALSKGHDETVRFAGMRFAQNGGARAYLPLLHKNGVAYGFGANVKSASVPEEAWPGAPAEMPVMPAPVIAVVAERGSTPAQMAGTLAGVALVIYGFIALVLFARLFAGVWFSRKLSRAARTIEPLYFGGANDEQNVQAREALRVLRLRSAIAGLKSAPALKESAALTVPATIGVAHPAILLPLNWRAWSSEQLDAVLAHEVSHVARRDALVQTLSLAHRAVFWFSPLAWWLDRQLTELAEQASDEAALAGGADRTRYAETLLGFFAQLESTPGRIWWQGVSMAKKSHARRAERRVDRILAWTGSRRTRKWFAVAVVAFAAPVIFLAASLHPVIAYGQDKTQSDEKNVIMPGGPKAPALPKAPKGGVVSPAILAAPQGGVPAVPAIAPAPQGGVQGGVVAPAIAPSPATPASAGTPVPGQGVEAPGPIPAAPRGGVVTPTMPPAPNPALAPSGPRTVRPSTPIPNASAAPMAPFTSIPSLASTAPVAAVAGVGTPAPQANQDEDAQSAELGKEVQDARKQIAADQEQVRQAQEDLAKAQESAQGSDTDQVRSAEANLREAQAKVDRANERLERIQERIERITEAREDRRAEEQAQRAQEIAQRDAERKQAMDERAMEQTERAQREAERAQDEAERAQQNMTISGSSDITINGRYSSGWGPRYVMLIGPKDVSMSGSDEDLQHAMRVHQKIGKDMIWFERDEKSYIITDPAFVAKARALFAPEDALAKQQDELGRQQDELGRQQDALGNQMDKVSVKPPDVTDELRQIQARLKELQATGATQQELGELQRELGELQRRIGEVQRDAGVGQAAIGRQQGELGRKQGELGRKQGELGRRQGEIAKEASRQLRGMFDDAIAKGIAKPE